MRFIKNLFISFHNWLMGYKAINLESNEVHKSKKVKAVIEEKEEVFSKRIENMFKAAMAITGGFEGDFIASNFDGQGLSFGHLNWAVGQGSFQEHILKPLVKRLGKEKIDAMFPKPITPILDMSIRQAVRYVTSLQKISPKGRHYWSREWRISFKWLHEVTKNEEQLKAARGLAKKAFNYMSEYKTGSPMSFYFFFDVVVQNGSMKGLKLHANTKQAKELAATRVATMIYGELDELNRKHFVPKLKTINDEQGALLDLICRRAKRNRWRNDVLNRKCSIIFGSGWVHAKLVNVKSISDAQKVGSYV